jgi:hypothetical protein
MQLHELTRNGQPEPQSCSFNGMPALERLEHVRQHGRRDPAPCVAHGQHRPRRRLSQGDGDSSGRWCVLDGVQQEI